jgi:hypothetical protein
MIVRVFAPTSPDSESVAWLPEDDFLGHFATEIDPAKAAVMYAAQQALHTSTFEDVMAQRECGGPNGPP